MDGAGVTESTLTSRIKAARRALDDSGEAQRRIATVQRRGYRFVATVVERPAGSAANAAVTGTVDGFGDAPGPAPCAMLNPVDPAQDRTRLAVIPFARNPGSAEIAWRADTLTEEISLQLARIPGFVVISRNSTFSYKDREISLRQIGQELGVRYLVEGSLWEAEARLRVSIQLLDAASGQLLWADRRDLAAGELPKAQDAMVREIVSHIEPEILRAELPALRQRAPVDLGAWALYRQAHGVIGQKGWCETTFAEAADLLRRAIQQSPELAFAHAYLALVLAIGHLIGLVSGSAVAAEAQHEAERALALDGQDSDVLGYAGCAFADLGDIRRGIGLLERAVELDPSNAQAHAALGAAMLKDGNADGIAHLRYGMQISPRDNRLPVWGTLLARGLLSCERIDEAIEAARAACRHGDRIFLPRIILAIAYAQSDAPDDAAVALADARRIRPQLKPSEITWIATPTEIEMLTRAGLL